MFTQPFNTTEELKTWIFSENGLGFCGCGCPTAALTYLRDILRAIKNKTDAWNDKNEEKAKAAYKEISGLLFEEQNKGAFYLIHYFLDSKRITEHGGSVGGCWLSDFGEALLEELETIQIEELCK